MEYGSGLLHGAPTSDAIQLCYEGETETRQYLDDAQHALLTASEFATFKVLDDGTVHRRFPKHIVIARLSWESGSGLRQKLKVYWCEELRHLKNDWCSRDQFERAGPIF